VIFSTVLIVAVAVANEGSNDKDFVEHLGVAVMGPLCQHLIDAVEDSGWKVKKGIYLIAVIHFTSLMTAVAFIVT